MASPSDDDTLVGALEQVEWSDATLAAEPGALEPGSLPAAAVSDSGTDTPSRIGRYLVLERLGAGGMGIVVAAYDPELDRKLAIKLIRPGRGLEHGQERMLREAQAMAKLAHPNVIAIYDVGVHARQVYIAMELVTGRSLGDLLDETPADQRDLAQVIDQFVQAGRGLAAAHEVGLVHRDFKPDNVLVGDDGRVRVLDFGLARASDDGDARLEGTVDPDDALTTQEIEPNSDSRDALASHSGVSRSRLSQEVTRAGSLLGTPAYMPPEHLAGQRSDARGDQFSFCVALWEGIYGKRPFVGATIPELFYALQHHRISAPPAKLRARVPDWLHAAIERGLASDPTQRWPDMPTLLAALQPPPARTRWWMIGVAGLALALSGGALWSATRPDAITPCSGLDAPLIAIWDDARRERLREVFASSGRDYAQRSADTVIAKLDAWADDWVTMRSDACQATHVRSEQSEELLDLRVACLDRRLAQLDALVRVLESGEASVLEQAADAVASLEGLQACADVEALRGRMRPPEDPAVVERIRASERELDTIEALHAAGRYQAAKAQLDALAPTLAEIDWAPLTGRAAFVRGQVLAALSERDPAKHALAQALAAGVESRDDRLTAEASVELAWVMRRDHASFEQLPLWQTLAEAELEHVDDPRLRARLESALGDARWEQAKYDEAIAHHERALALLVDALGPDHLQTITSRTSLAMVYRAKGELERAREILQDTRARYLAELGPDHPWIANVDNELGSVAWQTGDYAGALQAYERALAIREAAFGKDHPSLSSLVGNIGSAKSMLGEFEAALPYFRRAVELYRQQGDSTLLASNLDNLASGESRLHNFEAAQALYREAYEVRTRLLAPDHPDLARSLINMGQLEVELGHPEQARDLLEQAVALREHVEVQTIYRARARWQLAEALTMLGDKSRVPELLDQAREDYKLAGIAGGELEGFEQAAERLRRGQPKPPRQP